MNIQIDPVQDKTVIKLLQEHLDDMAAHSPPESVHALDLESLRASDVSFWTAWEGKDLLGCGALKELDGRHGEIKSMRTASGHLRKGVAAELLQHIIREARIRGLRRLSLETGSPNAFKPAQAMYERAGFQLCEPFADYKVDPYSIFMTLEL